MLYEIVNVDVIFWVFLLHFSFLYFWAFLIKLLFHLRSLDGDGLAFYHLMLILKYRIVISLKSSCCFTRKKPV